jgi:hypothetical protein
MAMPGWRLPLAPDQSATAKRVKRSAVIGVTLIALSLLAIFASWPPTSAHQSVFSILVRKAKIMIYESTMWMHIPEI